MADQQKPHDIQHSPKRANKVATASGAPGGAEAGFAFLGDRDWWLGILSTAFGAGSLALWPLPFWSASSAI